jgi:hypothetical protein
LDNNNLTGSAAVTASLTNLVLLYACHARACVCIPDVVPAHSDLDTNSFEGPLPFHSNMTVLEE